MIAELAPVSGLFGSCSPGDLTVSAIFRNFFIAAGAITALFVARDALYFTIMQTFVAVLLVTAIVDLGSFWSQRRKTQAARHGPGSVHCHFFGSRPIR
jgi:hypothetical protein